GLAHRAIGALACGVLAGRVLQYGEVQRPAVVAVDDASRRPVPALRAGGVEEAPFAQRRRVGAAARRLQDLASLAVAGLVLRRLQLDRVAADDGLACEAAERDEGVVDVDEAEVLVLQRRRKRRLPEDLQRFLDRPR